MDRWNKYQLYEKAGVKEYWIVDPNNESVEVHLLEGQSYKFEGVFTKGDTVPVHVLKGLELELNQIFI